ncbi:PilN domain-containing protein [Polaromonas sp. JS666]|uniref:PilN domain-containing protein n=1 Tax=Polaromonas sp. (strain JS666 / ATCC BAA-500) TaxID=296591 RepID=UPI000046401C|nr:PilN domain-containing protein [Polaromonas sp. JS666]ABE42738.1 Fimbrial assembly [Polaromonas sp. JS666]
MILINLLPHREAARKRRREVFYATLGVAALAGVLISGAVYTWYLAQIESQQTKNNFLKTEITRLEGQIKEIATLQAEIAALRARQNAVEDLQGNRNLPVYLLSELVKQLPDGVYINSMKQDNQTVLIIGVAQSNERVSELLRNLANNSPWLTKPELVEITAGSVTLSQRDQRRVANFSMRVGLKRASDPKAASSAASSSVAGPALPAASSAVAKPAPVASASAAAKI